MVSIKDIEALAELSKLEVSPEECEKLRGEIDAILAYISEITEVAADLPEHAPIGLVHNILREDGIPHESGMYTEDLLNAAPARKEQYLQVKKILG